MKPLLSKKNWLEKEADPITFLIYRNCFLFEIVTYFQSKRKMISELLLLRFTFLFFRNLKMFDINSANVCVIRTDIFNLNILFPVCRTYSTITYDTIVPHLKFRFLFFFFFVTDILIFPIFQWKIQTNKM